MANLDKYIQSIGHKSARIHAMFADTIHYRFPNIRKSLWLLVKYYCLGLGLPRMLRKVENNNSPSDCPIIRPFVRKQLRAERIQ